VVINRFKRFIAAVMIVGILVLPGAAFAQSGVTGYSNQAGAVQGQINDDVAGTSEASGSSLPFTGSDLAIVAAAGIMLASLGVGLRRLTHAPREA
jgi:hypothetical protein